MCITFQVLKDFYYQQMSVTQISGTTLTEPDNQIFKKLYTTASFWQSHHTSAQLNTSQKPGKQGSQQIPHTQWLQGDGKTKFRTRNNSIYGQTNYKPNYTKLEAIRQ